MNMAYLLKNHWLLIHRQSRGSTYIVCYGLELTDVKNEIG